MKPIPLTLPLHSARTRPSGARRLFGAALLAGLGLATAMTLPASAAPAAKHEKKPAAKHEAPYERMDYGPFLSASFLSDPHAAFDNGPGTFTSDSTARGIAIKLSDDFKAGVIFDQDLMRVSCAWVDGGMRFRGLIGDGQHGWDPSPTVSPLFESPHGPGWANSEGSFKDPRSDAQLAPLPPAGPLPRSWAKYKGLYRHGEQVVLSYAIDDVDVLESPSLKTQGGAQAIVRSFTVAKSPAPLSLIIATGKCDPSEKLPTKELTLDGDSAATLGDLHIAVVGAPAGSKLEKVEGDAVALKLPAMADGGSFEVLVAGGGDATKADFEQIVKSAAKPDDLTALTHGGPSLWKQTVQTKGVVSADTKKPYVVDTVTIPYENPYHSWMRIAAFDFFPDGHRAALSTWSGDVWIVSGIDKDLDHLTWKRFATGLHQPLGLKIVDNTIYTVGHDQITKLVDLDGDGEADYYEDFNSDWQLTSAFHAFCFDLQTDPEGNFYFAFGSPVHAGGGGFQKISADHGSIIKVSKDGKYMEHYAEGLRAPNGMCVGPDGQVTCSDNEGSWVPASPLHWVKQGMFLGVTPSAHRPMKSTDAKADPAEAPRPLCWLSHNDGTDNSSGGQVWVTSDKWGPFKGDLLFLSYGESRLFKVMHENVDGEEQGGVVAFPLNFTSSCMRARMNPADGQVYISGLRGWQTNAGKEGGFDRVRYTGAPVRMPKDLHVTSDGVAITFTCPLDKAEAEDVGNYGVEVWNYLWHGDYGSPEVSTEGNPTHGEKNKPVHDTLDVKSAKLLPDGKTVVLQIAGIKPVMQMKISYSLDSADKTEVKGKIYNTIYHLGAAPTAKR